jgi:hypothetical protein
MGPAGAKPLDAAASCPPLHAQRVADSPGSGGGIPVLTRGDQRTEQVLRLGRSTMFRRLMRTHSCAALYRGPGCGTVLGTRLCHAVRPAQRDDYPVASSPDQGARGGLRSGSV